MEESYNYWKSFVGYVFSRFKRDKCTSVAAELTLTSLLALVPLLTVIFSLLALIPNFSDVASDIQSVIFEFFAPSTGESVQRYLSEFVDKAKGMGGFSFPMLLVTALLMMRTIDASFNHIWQIKTNKSVVRTFLVYWAILTLGPLFLGSSILLSSYLKSLPMISDVVTQSQSWLSLGLPMLMEIIAFALMFYVIPNRKIRVIHAAVAALITTVLFEIAKYGFSMFIEYFSTYQIIFGALASIPLFLIWVYLSWSIILVGAETCHGFTAFEVSMKSAAIHPFIAVVELLVELAKEQAQLCLTENNNRASIVDSLRLMNNKEDSWGGREARILLLEKLTSQGVVAKLENQTYCLRIAASDLTFEMVMNACERQLPSRAEIEQSQLSDQYKDHITHYTTALRRQNESSLFVSSER